MAINSNLDYKKVIYGLQCCYGTAVYNYVLKLQNGGDCCKQLETLKEATMLLKLLNRYDIDSENIFTYNFRLINSTINFVDELGDPISLRNDFLETSEGLIELPPKEGSEETITIKYNSKSGRYEIDFSWTSEAVGISPNGNIWIDNDSEEEGTGDTPGFTSMTGQAQGLDVETDLATAENNIHNFQTILNVIEYLNTNCL